MNAGRPSDRAVLREPEAAVRDRELLELAALAAGLEGDWSRTIGGWDCLILRNKMQPWQPLHDDGDALRLAVKLRMVVSLANCCCCATVDWDGNEDDNEVMVRFAEGFRGRECETAQEATRLAIVRAAAAIGGELRKAASGCSHTARSDGAKE